ncbi:MAG: nucleotidyltransferase [Clostridiales bacterium]|nr:nucleotidyltransferase [Clostridiales bacterium]
MALTVSSAFNSFLNNTVNIQKGDSDKAKRSRDFLIEQISNLSSEGQFLKLAPQYNCFFGSFSRKTKICVIDDIDFLLGLNGGNLQVQGSEWDNITLKVKDNSDSTLVGLSDKFVERWTNTTIYQLNSTKVKNSLINALNQIDQYEKAEIHSRGEAVTLKLKSHPWNFDIVPAFYCSGDAFSKPYYLIPNGKGKWKKTNPKVEQERISKLNQDYNGMVLETVRLVKYWNRYKQMPNISSYVLETMVLDYFDKGWFNNQFYRNADNVYMHFSKVLEYISNNVYNPINDPKGIQGNINNLFYDQKTKIAEKARGDYANSVNAIACEMRHNDHHDAITKWREIFGMEFPNYGY